MNKKNWALVMIVGITMKYPIFSQCPVKKRRRKLLDLSKLML